MAANQEVRVAGAVTYWSLGGETSQAAVRDGLEALGLEEFAPEERSDTASLKSAISSVFGGKGRMVRPLANADENGFIVIQEEQGETENSYSQVVSARMCEGQVVISAHDEQAVPEEKRALLRGQFAYQKSIMGQAAVAKCLTGVLEHLGATTLRPKGGVYWIPEDQLATYQQAINVIEKASIGGTPNSVYLLRTVFDADAVKAVKDAIIREVTERSEEITESAQQSGLRESTYRNRATDASRLHDRITAYEAILGETLEELHGLANETELNVFSLASNAFPDLFPTTKETEQQSEAA